MIYRHYVKRCIDFTLAGTALFFLSPLLLLVALAVRLSSSGPVFYKQERLGRNGTTFIVSKFRSMTDRFDRRPGEAGELTGDNNEITGIGKWIRRFKIDELPQLLSVFRGDMSFVGPRPCLPELADDFDDNGRKRMEVRPGCTGLAQVNGNIFLSWPERWKYDSFYVENLSFKLDVKIFLRTLWLIVNGEERLMVPFDVFVSKQKNGGGQ